MQKQELLQISREGITGQPPEWMDQELDSRVDRFVGLPSTPISPPFNNETVLSIEGVFPTYLRSAYLSAQNLQSANGTAIVLNSLENIEYRLLVLELARGVNTAGWKVIGKDDDSVIIIAHPNFVNTEKFRDNLVRAKRSAQRRIAESEIIKAFNIHDDLNNKKEIVFLVEDNDVWPITGTTQLKESMNLWWVRELGDGISAYYTQGKTNLDNPTILTANEYHEFVHKLQKEVLTPEVFDRLFGEFSLIEGMASWWERLLIRDQYTEKDFLSHYLLNEKFMSTFLTSQQLLVREGHKSIRFPWNAVLSGMIFQRIGMLAEAKEKRGQISEGIGEFNLDQVIKGLQTVSQHFRLANEFAQQEGNLTEMFLEELCRKEFGAALEYQKLLKDYDERGYDYAFAIISRQALTANERISFEEQVKEYKSARRVGL